MKSPAVVEADFAEFERTIDQRETLLLHVGGNLVLALIRNTEIAAQFLALASGVKGQRAHLRRYRLQRNPRRNRPISRQRPVVLIGVSGSDAAARLLVK